MPPKTKTRTAETKPSAEKKPSVGLGDLLRAHRDEKGWSLRVVAARAGVNHGYLSLVERGDVAEPAPSMLHKLAIGYELPFEVLMRWAGYLESDPHDLSENQRMALSVLGDDISTDELEAVKAVLAAIRARGATFSSSFGSLDIPITPEVRADIRNHVTALLRRADCYHVVPTPLHAVMEVSKLVLAGEIALEPAERSALRRVFGDLVDAALDRVRGVLTYRSQEIWVKPDLHEMKRRFVTAHEIGHFILPWQRAVGYFDDDARLRPDFKLSYEREANQAAIEILSQGDYLRRQLDDSRLRVDLLGDAADDYQISRQAMFRYAAEETKQTAATAIRFRGQQGYGPTHPYYSATFAKRFGWGPQIPESVELALAEARRSGHPCNVIVVDLAGVSTTLEIDVIDTQYAALGLIMPERKHRLLSSVRRAS